MDVLLRTQDFERILKLPRRVWDETDDSLARRVTEVLRTPNGTMTLWPVQAQAIYEAVTARGLFAPIPVGGGKTLISLLIPTALGSKRPLLLLPAKLIEKTYREWAELRRHWQTVRHITIVSYEALSRVNQTDLLNDIQPDVILCDEAHKVKNKRAAVSRRLFRYLNSPHGRSNCAFVALSGTITKRSILDYHHIISRTHMERSPLPLSYMEAENWADALDNRPVMRRPDATLLVRTMPGTGDTILERARTGFQRRIRETEGVIALSDSRIGASLTYRKVERPADSAVNRALSTLYDKWELPDGFPLTDPMALWRHARELLMGFFYRWEPRAPRDWLDARKAWGQFVRAAIKNSKTLDSELMVARAFSTSKEYQDWANIRDTFKPNSVPEWISEYNLHAEVEPGMLLWVEHNAFGRRLAEKLALPFFSQGDTGLEALKGTPAVVSIQSNAEGKNLQDWHRNIVFSPPQSGILWEQMVGRTHRNGQSAEEVTVDIVMNGQPHVEAIEKAKADALYVQQSTGQIQKILYGDWT